MSDWLFFQEVLEALKIKDFEIFKYLQNGLQPYEKGGKVPFDYPKKHHEYFLRLEQDKKLNPKTQEGLREILFKRISDIADDDPNLISWKYLIVPKSPDEINGLLSLLSGAYFKKKDIMELEQVSNANIDTPVESTHQNESSYLKEPQNPNILSHAGIKTGIRLPASPEPIHPVSGRGNGSFSRKEEKVEKNKIIKYPFSTGALI